MLARIGAAESDLQCGCHPPLYYGAHGRAGGRRGAPLRSTFTHNCSGKAPPAFSRLLPPATGTGWPTNLAPGKFALQVRIRNTVATVLRERSPGRSRHRRLQARPPTRAARWSSSPTPNAANWRAGSGCGRWTGRCATRCAATPEPRCRHRADRTWRLAQTGGGGLDRQRPEADGVQAIGVCCARGAWGIAVA